MAVAVREHTGREADKMARTTLRAKEQLTLPDDVRKAAKLQEGDLIEAEVTEKRVRRPESQRPAWRAAAAAGPDPADLQQEFHRAPREADPSDFLNLSARYRLMV